MKVKKMYLDGPLNNKPEGTTLQNRNVVIRKKPGSWTGEPGTLLLGDLGKPTMGEIQLPDNTKLLFLRSDELAIINGNGFYSLKKSSVFDFSRPIHGKAAYNHKNEIVVVWTDGRTPGYLNLSKIPTTITADNINLNVFKNKPTVTAIGIADTGALASGVYYPMIQGITEEGSLGSWTTYKPLKIFRSGVTTLDQTEGQKSGVPTNMGIRLTITSGEYTKYNFGYIYKQDGQLYAYNVGKGTTTFTYTGSEIKTTVPLDEALLERAYYKNVGLVETLGNVLYLADLETYEEPDIQIQVNNIGVTWVSELVSVDTLKLNTQLAGLMPGEVYALYFRYIYKWGRGSWFTIPGRAKLSSDVNFLTQDTANAQGVPNYWENSDEKYPDEARFGSLRNTPVRHHGVPSLNYLRNNIHKGAEVGTNYLPRVTFQLSNIPTNADSIGWELGYAERTPNNSLVLAQSPVINSVYDTGETTLANRFGSLGGNFLTVESFPAPDGFINTAVEGHLFRLHPFELLLGSTAQAQAFRKEYKLTSSDSLIKSKIRRTPGSISGEEFAKPNFRYYGLFDYRNGIVETVAPNTALGVFDFVPKDVFFKRIDNFSLEKTYILDTGVGTNPFPVTSNAIPYVSGGVTVKEQTYLVTLLTNTKNCYKSYDRQEIVIAGSGNLDFIWDTYATEYTYHTYGKKRANEETYGVYDAGMVFARRTVLYSVHPIALRNTNPGAVTYTQYYPKEQVVNYMDSWTVDKEPNGFIEGYNKDFTAIDNITPGTFFDATKQHKFTNWVTRSQIYQSTDNWFGWRDFRLNDVLIMAANNGKITNLVGVGDLMYIHFENNLYLTRGGEELQILGQRTTYVGTGDIFAAQPQEVIHGKYGALGLQHRICAVLTDYGYCFVDAVNGIGAVYLVNGKDVKIISDDGMVEFFRENLAVVTDPIRGRSMQLGYDPVFKRLLIMHKGKLPLDINNYRGEYRTGMVLQGGDIVFKDGNFVRVVNAYMDDLGNITA